MANTYDFVEVKFNELVDNINTFIKDLYNKSDINLSPADPYGQILDAVTKIHETSLLYLKNVTGKFDINNPDNENLKMVRALARIAGLDPSRNLSATGTISMQLKPGVELTEIPGSEIIIMNNSQIKNNSNNIDYYIDLGGVDYATYKIEKGKKIYLPLVQGNFQTQTFTGNNTELQSFTIILPSNQTVEQYRVYVKVNGETYTRTEHLYDMLPGDKSFVLRTGIEGAVDIYFGTNDFGFIPPLGVNIEIKYVVSRGSNGNIAHKLVNDFTFSDELYDGFGASISTNDLFDIYIEDEISFGADSQSIKFTKATMPFVSRNLVLARPEQYIFMLKRLNVFSQIDAFTTEKGGEFDNQESNDDSVVYLFLIPNFNLYLTGNNSYFDLDMNAFYLDIYEKNKVEKYLRTMGTISVGTSIKILEPIIRKYVINVYLRIFEDSIEDNVRSEILNKLSSFFGDMERRGRIDKSAIIKIIEEIAGVDSVMVEFISEANETYHKEFEEYKKSIMVSNPLQNPDLIIMDGYEKNKVIGLDPKLGDITYNKAEVPVIRGGWQTRDGIYFKETPQTVGLGSVNIMIEGISKNKLF